VLCDNTLERFLDCVVLCVTEAAVETIDSVPPRFFAEVKKAAANFDLTQMKKVIFRLNNTTIYVLMGRNRSRYKGSAADTSSRSLEIKHICRSEESSGQL